jgi:hypothetical protein
MRKQLLLGIVFSIGFSVGALAASGGITAGGHNRHDRSHTQATVRDHRTKPVVRDHRSKPVVHNHRSKPVVHDHRKPPVTLKFP